MTGKYFVDVFGGSGFLAKTTKHLDLRGYVFDTKFGPKYDVTKPLVLTRIRQHVSTLHDNTLRALPQLFPPVLPSQTRFIVLACLGFWSTHVIHGCGTYRKSKVLQHSLARFGPWRMFQVKNMVIQKLSHHASCFARKCAGTDGRCSVSKQKHVHQSASASRSEFRSSRDHARPPKLSFALAMFFTMNARRFQKTHFFAEWEMFHPKRF